MNMGIVAIILGVLALIAAALGTWRLSQKMKKQKNKEQERLLEFRKKRGV